MSGSPADSTAEERIELARIHYNVLTVHVQIIERPSGSSIGFRFLSNEIPRERFGTLIADWKERMRIPFGTDIYDPDERAWFIPLLRGGLSSETAATELKAIFGAAGISIIFV